MATSPLTDQTTRNDYTATASQTTFPYTFWIKDEDHLDVYVNGTLQTLGGGNDYTITATQSVTGSDVVFNTGLALNDKVAIVYNPDIERATDFTTGGSLRASAMNLELTYGLSIDQYFKTELERTLALSPSDSGGVSLELPTATADNLLGWNSGATALINYPSSSFTGPTGPQGPAGSIDNIDTLPTATPSTTDTLPFTDVDDSNESKKATTVAIVGATLLDEDNMASDSATQAPTQQSVKAYVDTEVAGISAGGWVPLQTQTVSSAVASVDFTSNIDSTYKAYAVIGSGITVSSSGVFFYVRTSNDGGATFDNTSGDYKWSTGGSSGSNSNFVGQEDGANTDFIRIDSKFLYATAGENFNFSLVLRDPSNTALKTSMEYTGVIFANSDVYSFVGGGTRDAAEAVDGLRFYASSGNITGGTLTLYGLAGA